MLKLALLILSIEAMAGEDAYCDKNDLRYLFAKVHNMDKPMKELNTKVEELNSGMKDIREQLRNITESTEINGGWSVWADWTDCSATCNAGVQTRQRQCNNPVPSSGGQYCQGSQMDVVHCNKQQCSQINGGWSVWANWTDCSATCDAGVQTRQRECNNPEPSSGGQYCQGSQMDVVHCNKQQCSQTNGGWSVWADWTDCSATCNTGLQTRQRQCNNPEPSSGGQYCQGSQMDVSLCNKEQCSQRKVAFVGQHVASDNVYEKDQKVIFDKVKYNCGGGYDNTTGIFTAPKPGTYLFSFYVLSHQNASAHVFLIAGGKYLGEAEASEYTSAGNSDVVYLEKGEQVWIQTSDLQSQYYISAYKSQFMGVLLDYNGSPDCTD